MAPPWPRPSHPAWPCTGPAQGHGRPGQNRTRTRPCPDQEHVRATPWPCLIPIASDGARGAFACQNVHDTFMLVSPLAAMSGQQDGKAGAASMARGLATGARAVRKRTLVRGIARRPLPLFLSQGPAVKDAEPGLAEAGQAPQRQMLEGQSGAIRPRCRPAAACGPCALLKPSGRPVTSC